MKTAKKGWRKFAARGLLCLSLTIVSLLAADTSTTMADDTAGQPLACQENTPQPYVWFLCKEKTSDPPGKKGHAALLVFDGTNCYYYSYGPGKELNPDEDLGFPNDNMFAKPFGSVAEAKAYITGAQEDKDEGDVLSDYQLFIRWKITAEQAATILAVPPLKDPPVWTRTHWDAWLHNCWHMVYDSIHPTLGDDCIKSKPLLPIPEDNYDYNKDRENDRHGPIDEMDMDM